jgi:hypothetical protein
MKAVYIVSTIEQSQQNNYKFGRHTGTIKKLKSRYVTPLINPIVHYFRFIKNADQIESTIKTKFDNYRIINQDGTKTEWFNMKLNDLISGVEQTISKINPFCCPKCGDIFINNIDLLDHLNNNQCDKNQYNKYRRNKNQYNKNQCNKNKNNSIIKTHCCSNCGEHFKKKSTFIDHLNRKNPCDKKKNKLKIKCEYCPKKCSGRYSLNRHIRTKHKNIVDKLIENNDNSIENNDNSIEKNNDNSKNDTKSIIYELIENNDNSKNNTKSIIYELIENNFSSTKNNYNSKDNTKSIIDELIKNNNNSKNNIIPKKKLDSHFKNIFFDNRHLVITSRKNSGKPTQKLHQKKSINILKDGCTAEDLENFAKDENKQTIMREIAKDLITKINQLTDDNAKQLIETIENTFRTNELDIIIRLLIKSYCFGHEINSVIIKNQIEEETEFEKILFGQKKK